MLAQTPHGTADSDTDASAVQLLRFAVGDERYAVRIDAVREILKCQEQDRPWKDAQVRLRIAWSSFTRQFGPIRVRRVDYTPGYLADHWCVKGHILFVLEGELVTELEDGRVFTLGPGQSYQVADNAEPHRSRTAVGAKLFIVD